MADTPTLPSELPVVPLRGAVVLPMTVAPLGVSRSMSSRRSTARWPATGWCCCCCSAATKTTRLPTICTASARSPSSGRWPRRRTACGCSWRGSRGRAPSSCSRTGHDLRALLKPLPEPTDVDRNRRRVRRVQELVDRALSLATGLSPDIKALVSSLDDPLRIAYLLASLLDMKAEDKQKLLEEDSLEVKLDAVMRGADARDRGARAEGQDRVAGAAGDDRRAAAVLPAPAAEGDPEPSSARATANRRSCASASRKAGLPENTSPPSRTARVERLERMTPASPEYQMIRTYLDWVLDVPWDKPTEDRLDPVEARACSTRITTTSTR
jgi:ATP-dependent Lon protease